MAWLTPGITRLYHQAVLFGRFTSRHHTLPFRQFYTLLSVAGATSAQSTAGRRKSWNPVTMSPLRQQTNITTIMCSVQLVDHILPALSTGNRCL